MKQNNLFDLNIVDANQYTIAEELDRMLKESRFFRVLTLNSLMIISVLSDLKLKKWLQGSDLITADGQGIVLAMQLLNNTKVDSCSGIDLVYLLLEKSYRFYFVGARNNVINLVVDNVQKQFKNAKICGYSHGYLSDQDEDQVVADIRELKPDFILVGMGFPRQEKFIEKCSRHCDKGIAIGIGGVFDVLSGTKKKAPLFIKNSKLEWLFRAIQDPRRFMLFGNLVRYVIFVFGLFIKKNFFVKKVSKNI